MSAGNTASHADFFAMRVASANVDRMEKAPLCWVLRGAVKQKSRRGTDPLSDSLAARLASRKTRSSPVALRHRLSAVLL